MLNEKGIELKSSTLLDVAPDKEFQSIISVEAIRKRISRGLIQFGLFRCRKKLLKQLKSKKNPDFNQTTSSNVTPDTSSPGCSVTNSPVSPCKRLNGGATHGTKHQAFFPKRQFGFARRVTDQDMFLRLGYPGLHIWRHTSALPESTGLPSPGGFSFMSQIGISSYYRSIYRRTAPQLAKRIIHQAIPGYPLGYNVRLTHQAIKKVVRICSPCNPVRLFGIVSLVVSFAI